VCNGFAGFASGCFLGTELFLKRLWCESLERSIVAGRIGQ
jgi:hypothetical protein